MVMWPTSLKYIYIYIYIRYDSVFFFDLSCVIFPLDEEL